MHFHRILLFIPLLKMGNNQNHRNTSRKIYLKLNISSDFKILELKFTLLLK